MPSSRSTRHSGILDDPSPDASKRLLIPLGMISEAEFPSMNFQLEPGDHLVLISDGIVEAQSLHGDLFGFDRIRALLSKQVNAAEIANTAQAFGQQDDISVLSIQRLPAMIEAIP